MAGVMAHVAIAKRRADKADGHRSGARNVTGLRARREPRKKSNDPAFARFCRRENKQSRIRD